MDRMTNTVNGVSVSAIGRVLNDLFRKFVAVTVRDVENDTAVVQIGNFSYSVFVIKNGVAILVAAEDAGELAERRAKWVECVLNGRKRNPDGSFEEC